MATKKHGYTTIKTDQVYLDFACHTTMISEDLINNEFLWYFSGGILFQVRFM